MATDAGRLPNAQTWLSPAVKRYLKPFLIGKSPDRIDDLWQAMYNIRTGATARC